MNKNHWISFERSLLIVEFKILAISGSNTFKQHLFELLMWIEVKQNTKVYTNWRLHFNHAIWTFRTSEKVSSLATNVEQRCHKLWFCRDVILHCKILKWPFQKKSQQKKKQPSITSSTQKKQQHLKKKCHNNNRKLSHKTKKWLRPFTVKCWCCATKM